MLAAAYIGLLVAAFPGSAAQQFRAIQATLVSDQRFVLLCVALITAYATLWWITAREPKSHRLKLQQGIRPHYKKMSDAFFKMRSIETDEEWINFENNFDLILQPCAQWIFDNMGEAAFAKFNHPSPTASHWSWEGEHDTEIAKRRGLWLMLQSARVEVLDLFLTNDGGMARRLPHSGA